MSLDELTTPWTTEVVETIFGEDFEADELTDSEEY